MGSGELSASFDALASDSGQAAGNFVESAGSLAERAAAIEDSNAARLLADDSNAAESLSAVGRTGASIDPAPGTSRISDLLGPGGDPAVDPLPDPEAGPKFIRATKPDSERGPKFTPAPGPPGEVVPVDPDYVPSTAELDLQGRQVVASEPLGVGQHANAAYKITLDDGSSAVYKPAVGEDARLRQGIPGGLANREVATSRVNEALGFDLVPTTTMVDGAEGPGSLQLWKDGSGPLPSGKYPAVQQQQAAVLDYVTGNTDRHLNNYLTDPDGNLVAIDHGYSFPESPDPRFGIRSDFVKNNLNVPLSDEVVNAARGVDPGQLSATLRATGISDTAIDGVVARLGEVQSQGMITGDAWPGVINGAWVVFSTALPRAVTVPDLP